MKHPCFPFFRHLRSLGLGWTGALTLSAAEVVPLGDDLPGEIRGLFAPPTRSDAPWVASAEAVFQWDEAAEQWAERYRPPWRDTAIEGLGLRPARKIYPAATSGE